MDKIGKYEVLEEIGSGGFGTVYKGRDPFLKRIVAIKTCTSDVEEIRLRFYREAEIVGSLQHVNITMVHDFGIQDDVPFLVQEYLTGEDLDAVIKNREDLEVRLRLRYLLQIARGLEYAHANGIVHRDIKPANIRRLENGNIKVMDFGIAMLTDLETRLTRTGMLVGTAAYLAPEQIQGGDIDQRCDIFSFGVVAYELLTFERPFGGATVSNLLYQILNQEPQPLPEIWPECPPPIADLLARCLKKDRQERPASFAEVVEILLPLAETTDATSGNLDQSLMAATVGNDQDPTMLQVDGTGRQPISKAFVRPSRMALAASAMVLLGLATVIFYFYQGQWGPLALDVREPPAVASGEPASAAGQSPSDGEAIESSSLDDAEATSTAEESEPEPDDTAAAAAPPPPGVSRPTETATGRTAVEPTGTPTESSASIPTAAPRREPVRRPPQVDTRSREPEPASQQATTRTPERTPADPPVREPAAASPPPGQPEPEPARVAEQERQSPPATESNPLVTSTTSPTVAPPATSSVTTDSGRASSTTSVQAAEPAPEPIDETVGIRAALDAYQAAYESLDATALSAIWPSLEGSQRDRLARSFEGTQAIEMELQNCRIDVQGSTATAACRVRRVVRPKVGSRQSDQRATTFHLRKSGSAWLIDHL